MGKIVAVGSISGHVAVSEDVSVAGTGLEIREALGHLGALQAVQILYDESKLVERNFGADIAAQNLAA